MPFPLQTIDKKGMLSQERRLLHRFPIVLSAPLDVSSIKTLLLLMHKIYLLLIRSTVGSARLPMSLRASRFFPSILKLILSVSLPRPLHHASHHATETPIPAPLLRTSRNRRPRDSTPRHPPPILSRHSPFRHTREILSPSRVRLPFAEDPIEQWLEHGTTDNPVTCIISDFYLGWTQTLSVKTKIPRIVFRASSAFGACVDNSLWSHLPHLAVKSDAEPFQVPDLPVEISLRRMQISRSARMFQKFDPLSEFLRENRLLNMQSWGTIVNTFYDLESVYITQLHEKTGKPVWAVGPLIMQPLLLDEQTLGVQRWLDLQQAGSVLCVSLGEFGPEQMAELAWGLEGLDRPFVWFLNNGNETIDRFRERVGHRGLIITNGSAPPGLVFLSHPSVGGFMTRGDWNSTVASIAIGVPMITWPTEGDEFLNSMLVVELLQIGVRVCQGEEGFLPRDELKTAVEQILGGGEEAKRAREFGDLARNAMKEEGSSIQSVKAFVDEIHKLASTPELPP